MDIKSIIAKIGSDADLRTRFLTNLAGDILKNYFVTKNGELVSGDELKQLKKLNNFLNGTDAENTAVTV